MAVAIVGAPGMARAQPGQPADAPDAPADPPDEPATPDEPDAPDEADAAPAEADDSLTPSTEAAPDGPEEPLEAYESLDGDDGLQRDRHWIRMLGEMSVLFGVMETVYWLNKESNAFDFKYEADWHNLSERFVTLGAWSLDDNYYETNAWRHPGQGALNYLFARSNGFSALESYAVALGQSTVWELIGEYKEEVSVNDIILTPRAGSVVGESMWQLGSFFLRSDAIWPYRIVGNVLTGGKGVLDWLDGKPPARAGRLGALGLSAVAPHRFEVAITGGWLTTAGQSHSVMRASVATEMILIPHFDRPGRSRRLYAVPAFSDIRVETTRSQESIIDLEIFVRTGITTWHRKDLTERSGYNLMFGISSAYEYGLHVAPGRATRNSRDQIAIGHIGGGTVDLTVRRGDLQVRAVADLYGDYAMLRNYAMDAHRVLHPEDRVRSTIVRDNYYHALGFTGRGRVVADWRDLRLGITYQQDWFRSIQGLDRYQDEIVDDYPLTDRRGEGRAWLGYEFSLRPGLRLGLEAGVEVRHRTGTVKTTTQADTEHRQVGAVQLLF